MEYLDKKENLDKTVLKEAKRIFGEDFFHHDILQRVSDSDSKDELAEVVEEYYGGEEYEKAVEIVAGLKVRQEYYTQNPYTGGDLFQDTDERIDSWKKEILKAL